MSFKTVATNLNATIASITENSTPTFTAKIGHPDKVVIGEREPAYTELMNVDEWEDTYATEFDMNNPVAVVSVYAKGQDDTAHQRALELIDLVIDAVAATPTLGDDNIIQTLPLNIVWGERKEDQRLLRGGQIYLKIFKE
jgi:hypothetical protein